MSITNLTPSQLRKAANLKEKIAALEKELASLLSSTPVQASAPATKAKRKMSAKGLANLRAAQKKRWAKVDAAKPATQKIVVVSVPGKKGRKKMSSAAKAKQSAKMKAYWAAKKKK